MFTKKIPSKQIDVRRDDGVELETQFILRIPEEPAKILREAIESGAQNLKDRMNIKLDNDLRYGEVRLDHWLLYAKVVDIPTIIESLKTIDNKSFYKTADICQMMICKDEPEHPSAEEESPNKNKKKDPNKVDKKYLHPHGVTPPCKNIRRKRFRKTLKKKNVDLPEIEKEVKRLLRIDNDASNVKWEIINEEDENDKGMSKDNQNSNQDMVSEEKSKHQSPHISLSDSNIVRRDVAQHDIFGGEVSSSDEETNINVMDDIDENSHISADDSRLSDSNSNFQSTSFDYNKYNIPNMRKGTGNNFDNMNENSMSYERDSKEYFGQDNRHDNDEPQLSKENIQARIEELRQELIDLRTQRVQKEQEISSIQNQTLRQRLQDTLDNLLSQILDKEMEIQDLQSMYENK